MGYQSSLIPDGESLRFTDHPAPGNAEVRTRVLIIGTGVSGLCVAALLRKQGEESFLILEKAADLGGTWRDNHYPGCACDIPAHLYSLSFDPNPGWSRMFAPQPEILAYLKRIAANHDLLPKIRFDTAVVAMTWDEPSATWRVSTSDGQCYVASVVVSALGALHHPSVPRIPGIDRFRGERFHSATWNHDYDLTGKRVAVIGTGASSIQFLPRIVDRVAQLYLFQRSPPWILPRKDNAFDARMQWRFRHLPFYRLWFRAKLFLAHEERVGGFTQSASIMKKIEGYARDLLDRQVRDPVLRARLTPNYAVGCKRLLISSDWYPALQKPNVEVMTESPAEVRTDSIVTADGVERSIGAIIFGTGFDTQNNLSRLEVRGRDGETLAQRWKRGSQAYLGTMISGFPNLFVMLGPNSGLAHNSQIYMIESQARFILSCLAMTRRRGAGSLDVREEVQSRYNQELQERMAATVWQAGGCSNWYQDASGRNTLNWPATSREFRRRTSSARASDFRFGTPAAGLVDPNGGASSCAASPIA